jgi:hypothetical protein
MALVSSDSEHFHFLSLFEPCEAPGSDSRSVPKGEPHVECYPLNFI